MKSAQPVFGLMLISYINSLKICLLSKSWKYIDKEYNLTSWNTQKDQSLWFDSSVNAHGVNGKNWIPKAFCSEYADNESMNCLFVAMNWNRRETMRNLGAKCDSCVNYNKRVKINLLEKTTGCIDSVLWNQCNCSYKTIILIPRNLYLKEIAGLTAIPCIIVATVTRNRYRIVGLHNFADWYNWK